LNDDTHQPLDSPPPGTHGPVTTTVTRRVKPGHEALYDQFLAGINAAASRFPGHLGVDVFRPESASAGEYRIVYRFDTGEHLRAWLDSDERAAWLERAEPHVIGPMRTRFVTGLETWFTLPDRPGAPPPPPYKMALLTWLTIFPLITLVVIALDPLLLSRTGTPLVGGYGPAQAAKEALTRDLSAELAPQGIRVVGLRPQGMPETRTIKDAFEPRAKASGMTWEQWQESLASRTHPRRLMTLEEMADVAVFMASDKASGMTGTTVNLTMGSLDD
jgi:antibiotic biosynthesis monooxygenase (ABM) superfamily enzyme